MQQINLNDAWYFTKEYTPKLLDAAYSLEQCEKVRIPHTVCETPYHYFDEKIYQMLSGYATDLYIEKAWNGKRLLLEFKGAAHEAEVYVNGKSVMTHSCGYTAFEVEISEYVTYGEQNRIVVRLDSREQLNVPPFGHVIDYMTYGGIYRDVSLKVKEQISIKNVFVRTKDVLENEKALTVQIEYWEKTVLEKASEEVFVSLYLWKEQEKQNLIGKTEKVLARQESTVKLSGLKEIALWDIEHPNLYWLEVVLHTNSRQLDETMVRIGFREARVLKDGFYLNGKKVKLRGLNRHQSYPYVGYAMPKGPQQRDAELLKWELGCNAVRTSHYPQSHYFIDRCDELGLLVFMEIPGWQHIGGEEWKKQAVKNTEEMIIQYRNHPSIFVWGVRINESPDDHDFYEETNKAARALDDTRQTSGVRCITKSELLEDVYAYNDFLHDGFGRGVLTKKEVTSNMEKGYLISEHNGHMYPTKSFDSMSHLSDQILRHAKVLDDFYKEDEIAGCFGWCMFDYNTHKDFGSGDRICYHGVMDMFRNKKPAGYLYESQEEKKDVLYINSEMDIGEYPACLMQDVYAVTNADSVRLYKNDTFIRSFDRMETPFSHMPHGPILINDFIGDTMEKQEGFSKKKAEDVKKVLMDACKYGMNHLPLSTKLTAAKCILFRGMQMQDAVDLYQKYIGNWGGEATTYRFEAIKGGKIVKSVTKSPADGVHIRVDVDRTNLEEAESYDVACVRIIAESKDGNVLHFYNEPLSLRIEGNAQIIGPKKISFHGGMCGTYVKTCKQAGKATLFIKDQYGQKVSVDFTISVSEDGIAKCFSIIES